MKKYLVLLSVLFSILTVYSQAVENLWRPPRKKLIDASWSNPTVEYLVANLERMEKEAPVDGIIIKMEFTVPINGKNVKIFSHNTMNSLKWEYSWFTDQINKLKSLKFKKFTDNFLHTSMRPAKNMDWFNDEYWAAIANNYGIIARIARETGLTGFIFDPEEYAGKVWGVYQGRDRAKAITIARKRGQQVGNAIFKEKPDVKILSLFFFSFGTYLYGDAEASILTHSFFNGIMDVMPPEARILEGHEYFGYYAKNKDCFAQLRYDVDNVFLCRVSANNYQKYRNQVQLAAPFYLDSVTNNKNVCYKRLLPEIESMPRLDYIRQNLWNAMEASNEYVWCYSEEYAWWNKSHVARVKGNWETRMPGLTAIWRELSEISALDLSKAVNILDIPQLNKDPQVKEPGKWNFWRRNNKDNPEGKWKNGLAYIVGPQQESCVNQSVNIKGGKRYLFRVEARARSEKNSGTICLGTAFRDGSGKFLPQRREIRIKPLKHGNWESMVFLITAPQDAKICSYQLGVKKLQKGEEVEFRHPQLLELAD